MCKSLKRERNHIILQVAFAIDRYLASIEAMEMVCCFFDFQETRESLMKIQKPLIDLLVFGQTT